MECYYTKREYNEMKNSLSKEITNLKKELKKANSKIDKLKSGIQFKPDFNIE